MIKKLFLLFIVVLVLAAAVLFVFRDSIMKHAFEYALNQNAEEPVEKGSVELARVWINRGLRLHLSGVRMNLVTEKGRVPVEIGQVDCEEPFSNAFAKQGLPFRVGNLKFQNSQYHGLHGRGVLYVGKNWFFNFSSEIDSIGLEEIDWLNPENLAGSTGQIVGAISFGSNAGGDMDFDLVTHVAKPGGRVQAKLFSALQPYLPATQDKAKLEKIAEQKQFVRYQEADLKAGLVGRDRLKVLFRILVPEYNLNLNLSVEIKVDKENAFGDLAQLFGWIKVTGK